MMKRYTLIFQLLDPSITPNQVRDEVDRELLRLHPRITYKLGLVTARADGKMLAEIKLDGKREMIEATLKSEEWKLPIRLVSMGWGWLVSAEDEVQSATGTSIIDVDPLTGIEPLEGIGEFQLSNRRLWLRYISLIIFAFILILLLIVNAIHPDSPILQLLYIVAFTIWLFSLNDTPFDIRVYADKIICRQVDLELSYWWRKMPIQMAWEEISRLDYTDPVCAIYSSQGKRRFLLSERFGCKEKTLVLKIIAKRANLNFVEGNFRSFIYQRYDA